MNAVALVVLSMVFAAIVFAAMSVLYFIRGRREAERIRIQQRLGMGMTDEEEVITSLLREQVADSLLRQLEWLRSETSLPLAVGFGIGKPEQIDPLRGRADGVIVGSAIVREMQALADGTQSTERMLDNIGSLAKAMADKAHQPALTRADS